MAYFSDVEFTHNLVLLIGSSIILISLLLRIVDRQASLSVSNSTDDPLSQLGYAIIATKQKSLCPEKLSYEGKVGRLYYPLGFYWISHKLFDNFKFLQSFIRIKEAPLQNILNIGSEYMDKYIVFLRIISGLVFPVLTQICVLFLFLFKEPFHFFNVLSLVIALIIIDALYEKSYYAVSSRNAGLFLYSIFAFTLFSVDFNRGITLENLFDNLGLYVYAAFFLVSLFIFQISQRYSQCFVVTSLVAFLILPVSWDYILFLVALMVIILANIPFADFVDYAKTHIYNRIHDNNWSIRSYGNWRYGLCRRLNASQFKSFVQAAFGFSYIKDGFSFPAFYKSNTLSIFLVFRIYLYSAFILYILSKNAYLSEMPSYSILQIFVCATILPGVLCLLKPFQVYGAVEVYAFGNLAATTLSFGNLISQCFEKIQPIPVSLIFVATLFAIDSVAIIAIYFYSFIYKFAKHSFSGFVFGDMFKSIVLKGANLNSANVITTLRTLLVNYSDSKLSIVAHGTHLQPLTEICEEYVLNSRGQKLLECKFRFIDNINYGYQDDWYFHDISVQALFGKVKPDLILLDITRPKSKDLFIKLSRNNLTVLKFNTIMLVSLNKSFSKYMRDIKS